MAKIKNKQLRKLEDEPDDVRVHEDDVPLSVQERRQTVAVYELFREKAQWGEFYNMFGALLILLGGYFLTVPFYNVVCQQFGFVMTTSHKDYQFDESHINVFRKFRITFISHTMDNLPWEF